MIFAVVRKGEKMLDSQEIIKVLDNLIGSVEAVGETNTDNKRLERLKVLIDVTNWCLDGVQFASETCGRPEHSMHEIGWTAACALDEWQKWLEEINNER